MVATRSPRSEGGRSRPHRTPAAAAKVTKKTVKTSAGKRAAPKKGARATHTASKSAVVAKKSTKRSTSSGDLNFDGALDPGGGPASRRALRNQGRRTMRKLLDAAMEAFDRRGYHATRVNDIVEIAKTSHGTFYLYFSNKEDLLRALVAEAAVE